MKRFSFYSILTVTLLICTGCVSSSIDDSVAMIKREANKDNYRTVNDNVLTSIQALRSSQKITVQNESPIDSQSHTFVYELHNKELSHDDKIKIVSLVVNKNKTFLINIAPAKGTNTLDQLALSIARASALRLYISHFNDKVTIKFAPKLSTDTINLVSGV